MREVNRRRSIAACIVFAAIAMAAADDKVATKPALHLKAFHDDLAGTTLRVDMVPVVPKGGSKPFYIAKFETSWELFDTFVFGFDQQQPKGSTLEADAVTRPSKPYISMDRGFGHAGYPAISTSYLAAKRYCEWLAIKTGRPYRLPTVQEWQAACELAAVPKASITTFAWCRENAEGKTHELGSSKADALGCHDLYGNASEWCTDETGKGVTLGGTFKEAADALGCSSIVPYSADWNASDPQFPKSKWWLADGGFVGFRVVCDVKDEQ
ncbi:MAG: SUMF1/EgtB/PvdO family nonheme iron enzyme [Phycisphaerae bacterium]|nr:SUMF1/EgtB/PvdO family nonheme iron enzyme [Phycisphaerae bacterium]